MEFERIQSIVESILFVSGEPMSKVHIAKIADATMEEVETVLETLDEQYHEASSGLMIIRKGEEVQIVAKPENAPFIEDLVKSELSENISPAALEVLAIIAYRGPISKPELEALRGVNCAYALRSLLLRKLIEKSDNPTGSRGYVYSITFDFLKKLGVESVEKLPEYAILASDASSDASQ